MLIKFSKSRMLHKKETELFASSELQASESSANFYEGYIGGSRVAITRLHPPPHEKY